MGTRWAGAGMLLGVLAGGLAIAAAAPVAAQDAPTWAPVASERLIRLPAGYLERAIERDFRDSGLAEALESKTAALGVATASLADLQAAAERARGPLRDEMRHQFLVAKQEYLDLMGARQDLQRQRVDTQLALYKRLLDRLDRAGGEGSDPALVALAERRAAAIARFEDTVAAVDMKLFAASPAEESRYGREYRKHAAALADLVRAIDAHPMNTAPEIDGRQVGKAAYLAHLIAAAEAERALLDQKDLVLAHMAKLVALDAMALADEVDSRVAVAGGGRDLPDATDAVGFFTAPN